jgi:peptide/nickel transport system substrate-binding protein
VFVTQSGQYTDLIVRRDVGPGTNPDFVMGMKLLQDRELMKKSIALGYALTGNDQPIDPTNRFYFDGLPQRQFDPDKAKFHLKKANLGSAAIPVVASPAAMYSVDIAQVLQQSARQAGVNLDVKRMPADGYWSNHWLSSPVGFGSIVPRPNADTILTQFFKSDATWNESRWKDPKFDTLLTAARAETDLARRKQMYADMQTMIHKDSGLGIPLFLATIDGHSKKLKGLSPIPLGGMMGYAFAENVWLEG